MVKLENQLESLDVKKERILQKINERNKKRKILCKGCGNPHRIEDLTLIQTHHYVPSRSCTEGDYWVESELQFVCPDTEIINRILFIKNDSLEEQFQDKYKGLFKKIIDTYEKNDKGPSDNRVNNEYVSEHPKKFGLGLN